MKNGSRPLLLGTAWLASCAALCSCVGAPVAGNSRPSSSSADPQLMAQLRAMASRQVELERKIDRLEAQLDAMRSVPRSKAEAPAKSTSASLVPGNLTTVKLAPSASPGKAAPALPTEVALREPDEAAVEQMLNDPGPDTSGEEFESALKAISTGEVQRGAFGLQAFADKHPRDERAPTALLKAGLGLQTFGDPQSAVLAFDRVAQDYPTSKEAPEAMMRMADCQLKLKREDRAKDVYARVMSRYPGTPAAKAAEAGLKNLAEAKAAAQ
ncbi:MAG: tetratricopeptide repeat protein [Myxococcales bacterium]